MNSYPEKMKDRWTLKERQILMISKNILPNYYYYDCKDGRQGGDKRRKRTKSGY